MATQRISFEHLDVPPLHTGLFGRLAAAIQRWRIDFAQREALAQFDARMLQDIGITPADVWRETRGRHWFG
jgi:uncharacterized protein YjiS (DUF1127 family)